MPKLTYTCPICSKQLVLEKEIHLGDSTLYQYKCGHLFSKTIHKLDKADLDFTSTDGLKHARPYQEDGVEFIINSDFNCIIADQMRLGKTPQSLLALKNKLKERTPVLILVKGANLWQWTREFKTWTTELPLGIFPVIGGKAWVPPGFSAYILSMDTFSRPKMQEQLKQMQFKLVIVDEAHSFKNPDSNRSQALVDFIRFQNTGEESRLLDFVCSRCNEKWEEIGKQSFDKRIGHRVVRKTSECPKCHNYCYIQQQYSEADGRIEDVGIQRKVKGLLALAADQSTTEHERNTALQTAEKLKSEHSIKDTPCGLVLLTGTPIMNRAEEYFIPLNLIAPEKFNSLERLRREWLVQNDKGKWNTVNPHRLRDFKETIAPYILRREKEDVYKELPPINRIYTLIEPDQDVFVKQYNKTLDEIECQLASRITATFWDMKDQMIKLRKLCGMMKIAWTADYLETCLMDSDKQRYAVGIHHEAVRDNLFMKLGGEENCLKLSGEDNADRKDWVMRNFASSKQRILIINMLAGGVGMDFLYCNNVTILERQWNGATEEQFEFRFYNPDKSIKTDSTNIEYILIKGSFDHWWHDMVEEKKRIFGETVANNWSLETDSVSFRELMEKTVGSRL